MGKALSLDLRERVACYVASGHSRRAAGRVFGVGASTVVRLVASQSRTGSLAPKPQGRAPGTSGKLASHIGFLTGMVGAEPDITLQELADALVQSHGVTVQLSSIHRALRRAGLTYKKGLIATERQRASVLKARHDWTRRRQPIMRNCPERLVFIDETSVKATMTRLRGRCARGKRLTGSAPFGRWQTQTFIAGLTCAALICAGLTCAGLTCAGLIAPSVIAGAMDRTAFDTCIETQLAPALEPGTVVIPDNLATHKSPRAVAALKERRCRMLFLPACSPDPCVAKNSPPDCFLYAPHRSKWPSPS